MSSTLHTLEKIFGYQTFRPRQQEIIDGLINGRDGFVEDTLKELPAELQPEEDVAR